MRKDAFGFEKPGMGSVVTYQLAYRSDAKISLCARHAETPEDPLGPVQHGRHYGRCHECEREAERRAEARGAK